MKLAILRADDIDVATAPADLWRVYGLCWERGNPVCLSVVPYSLPPCERAGVEGELVAFLAEQYRAGLVEIALHGWQHEYGELAQGSVNAIRRRLEAGLAALRNAWPDVPVRVLVPPHEHISQAGLQAARELGLEICSTWAATRGGTRWAHWWGRLRRRVGLPFAPAKAGLWPTDVDVLDFEGHEESDWPATEWLLSLAGQWDAPVVFVQHYRRVLENVSVCARWLRWLERVMACPDVQFVRFCDV
jgi:hypothetical protein